MSTRLILSLVLLESGLISANYLEAESNYMKPKLERNNILNKKVWIKNKSNEDLSEKTNGGQYIFRSNSIAVNDVLQNNFDAFSDNFMQDAPFVSSYIQRSKRSPNNIRKVRPRKSLKNCVNKNDCRKPTINNRDEKTNAIGSKLVPDLTLASVFNDYPYEVAILLNNNKVNNKTNDNIATHMNNISESSISKGDIINLITIEDKDINIHSNKTKSNTTLPKRSSKYDYEIEAGDRLELITIRNVANENIAPDKVDHNTFNKDDRVWHQNTPISNDNLYKVIPKEPTKIKTVNERALVKVISTLTKTFKKIMKQHTDIKTIHHKLQGLNDDLSKNIADIMRKFNDFDIKYSNLMKLNDKIKQFESELRQKERSFKNKQKEMTNNLVEFENQQKKFLTQQKQFYAVQQLILAQNEKINIKQNLIAKTQSETSNRQNHFARILKKAKQMYSDDNNTVISKADSNLLKFRQNATDFNNKQVTHTSTSIPPSSESVKINLFSIPIANRIQNQDEILIKAKDHQPIDDLVYKFYFNNTFIDHFMKSKVLTSIPTTVVEDREVRNNVKSKRNELKTILFPVNRSYVDFRSNTVQRNKRWINHYSKKHYKKKNHGKEQASIINAKRNLNLKNNTNSTKGTAKNRTDPFMAMATNFCNEIRRNSNAQVLAWCIEKALRRLQYMDAKQFSQSSTKSVESKSIKSSDKKDVTTTSTKLTNMRQSTPTVAISTSSSVTGEAITEVTKYQTDFGQNRIFFPDNEELESNLKQYEVGARGIPAKSLYNLLKDIGLSRTAASSILDRVCKAASAGSYLIWLGGERNTSSEELKPDDEGNVYYEGSIHASGIIGTDSEGYSDLLPDPNSNSKVDMSPLAFDYYPRGHGYMM